MLTFLFAIMTCYNACGFCLLGLGMLWLPELAPSLVAPSPLFGMSTRELWLLLMGTVNASLGAGVLGWYAIKYTWSIPSWLEYRPVARPEPAPLALPQPTRAGI